MKKIVKLFLIITLLILVCGNVNVEAKSIKIHSQSGGPEGGGGVNTLTLNNSEYYIYVDEITGVGYLINKHNGQENIIGTCQVIIFDVSNSQSYIWCLSNEENLGTIEVSIIKDTQIITNIDGEIENLINCGSIVTISD